jgi:hypothetical protein
VFARLLKCRRKTSWQAEGIGISGKTAQTITLPNPLGKAQSGNGPVKTDPDVLRQAEQAVDDLQGDYPAWT